MVKRMESICTVLYYKLSPNFAFKGRWKTKLLYELRHPYFYIINFNKSNFVRMVMVKICFELFLWTAKLYFYNFSKLDKFTILGLNWLEIVIISQNMTHHAKDWCLVIRIWQITPKIGAYSNQKMAQHAGDRCLLLRISHITLESVGTKGLITKGL